tara:strand:- start:1075 stop:1680 length:606 start_codon:yes stop_codon:yes gene_type:complete
MHNLNVRILGPSSFILTLIQLKKYLKFNPISENLEDNISIILFHVDALQNKIQKNYIDNNKSIKICLGKRKNLLDHFDANLELPATLKEINEIVESTAAKKKFNKNSSIEIKSYFLNKNERKLSKFDEFIILTEKEVQLIDLFFNSKEPISKDNILSSVWNYSAEADTHTVETHIYRLRKKVAEKFMDEKFILSNKNGYYL